MTPNERLENLEYEFGQMKGQFFKYRFLGPNRQRIVDSIVSQTSVTSIPNNSSTDISLLDLTHDLAFVSTDADTVSWDNGAGGSATITLSNGRTFTISAGNTGNMAALTYIYLSPADSSTVLQATTTATTAMGANKKLMAIAQNQTDGAVFQVYTGKGGVAIHPDSVITASLSAIVANLGSITAGTIVLAASGHIRAGQTAFDAGTGYFLGIESSTPKFSIGVSTGNKVTWDGTSLVVRTPGITAHKFNIPWTSGLWTVVDIGVTTYGDTHAVMDMDAGTDIRGRVIRELLTGVTFDKNLTCSFLLQLGADDEAATHGIAIGFGSLDGFSSTDGSAALDNPAAQATSDACCFFFDATGTLFARAMNGGVETDTEITGITITNLNAYRIEFVATTEARFYVNSVLKATITTNLPDTQGVYFGVARGAAVVDYDITVITSPEIIIEL